MNIIKILLHFLLFLILILPLISESKTRSDVIRDAIFYSGYKWSPSIDNLLDIKVCYDGIGIINDSDGDGIDDRRQVYNSSTTKCDEDTSRWPFVVGNTYTGEAYAFGGRSIYGEWGFDSPDEFSSKINLIERWIAGARQEDVALLPNITVMPDDYKGFAGIDCSGLVSYKFWIMNYGCWIMDYEL